MASWVTSQDALKLCHFHLHSSPVPLATECYPGEILFLLQELVSWEEFLPVASDRAESAELGASTLGSGGGGRML